MNNSATSMYDQDVDFATVEEIHASAVTTMRAASHALVDFLEGGAGTERTLRANREAFDRWVIRPRTMSGVGSPHTGTSFLGVELATPILTAPFGGDGLFHREGHLAVARANEECGTVSIVPEAGTFSYQQVAEAAPGAAAFAQLHPFEHFEDALDRICRAGYAGLCVTIDCPTAGFRTRNRANRFDPDLSYFSGNTGGAGTPNVAEMFSYLFTQDAPAWTWQRLAEALADHGIPWIAKGVLSAETARLAIDAGASALLVSNHGGRQLDPAPASLDVLPEIVDAVADRAQIAFDSGIRTGSDIFTALALGADVVVLGRAAVYGLAAAGEHGVRRTIELLTEELRTLMILAGAHDLDALDPSLLAPSTPRSCR